MTDTLRITLSLRKLLPESRAIPTLIICRNHTLDGEVVETYPKPIKGKSPLSGTGIKWIPRFGPDPGHPEHGSLPIEIDMDISVPNAIVGQNVQHGTSVFAAGYAAFLMLRIVLISAGVPKDQLDLLGEEDVTLRGVTLTFLVECVSKGDADDLVSKIETTGFILNSDCKMMRSTNTSILLPHRDYQMKVYIKTELKYCKIPNGAPLDELLAPMPHIVRIEVQLGQRFLVEQGLTSLAAWKTAYDDGLYERLFNETVRRSLRLDEKLRNSVPEEKDYAQLTPTEATLVRGYLAGNDPRKFSNITESATPAKRFSTFKRAILDKVGIDITIPWDKHSKLSCSELDELLHYPGDYHPPASVAPWCFCKESWPTIFERIQRMYEEAAKAWRAVLRHTDLVP